MRVSGTAIKNQVALPTKPDETSPSGALFAAILAGAGDQKTAQSKEYDSPEAQDQKAANSKQESSAGVEGSPGRAERIINTPAPINLLLRPSVKARMPQSSAGGACAADLETPKTPGKTPPDGKRVDKSSDHACAPDQIANANPLLVHIALPPIAQPIAAVGLTVPLGKLSTQVSPERDRNIAVDALRDCGTQSGERIATRVSAPADYARSDDPRQASGAQNRAPSLDLTLDSGVQSASIPVPATPDLRTPAPDASPLPAAPIAPSAPTASVPPAECTDSGFKLPPNPTLSASLQPQPVAAVNSSLPVKSATRATHEAQGSSMARSREGNQQASGDSQDATSAAATPDTRATTNHLQAQVQPMIEKGPSHEASSQARATGTAPHAAAVRKDVAVAADTALSAPAPGVNTARLVQALQHTEMRVGMRSVEFGEVSIRSSISQQQVIAQISASHDELARAISDHLPSLQTKLDHYGLHASIEVSQGGMSFGGEQEQASAKDHKPQRSGVEAEPGTALGEHQAPVSRSSYVDDDGRIDLRA